MAVFTLSIDTPTGLNSDVFFNGLLPVQWFGSGRSGTTAGSSDFFLLDGNGVQLQPQYRVAVTGKDITIDGVADLGVSGTITSADLT